MKTLIELHISGGFHITQDERPSAYIIQYWVGASEVSRQVYMDCLETAKFGEQFDASGSIDKRLESIQDELMIMNRRTDGQ